jgi:hypothetical protein
VVIDSDDLVARPDATLAAYCAAVGLLFIPQALRWEPGGPEWRRTARWHADVGASSGFERRDRTYRYTVDTSDVMARCEPPITSPSTKISTRSGSMSRILTTRRRDARASRAMGHDRAPHAR